MINWSLSRKDNNNWKRFKWITTVANCKLLGKWKSIMVIGIAAGLSAGKLLPAIGGVALKVIPAIGVASTAAASAGKIAATVTTGIKVATGIIGVGKLAIIPILIAALAYYHYDVFDPENRPFNVKEVDHEYDFIVVGSGGAGAVVGKIKTFFFNF